MVERTDPHTAPRAELETRFDELDARLRAADAATSKPDPGLAEIEAELMVMREALDDLKTDVLDLHNQLLTVVSSCERILAGAAGGSVDVTLNRGIPARGAAFGLRKAARRAVRAGLGAARRALRPATDAQVPTAEVEVRLAAEPATSGPTIAAVVFVTGDPADTQVPAAFAGQTDPDLEVVLWNRELGQAVLHGPDGSTRAFAAADRRLLANELSSSHLFAVSGPGPRFTPTLVEVCRWTLASEGIPLMGTILGGASGSGRSFLVEPIGRWTSDEDENPVAEGSILAKVVGGADVAALRSDSDSVVHNGAGGCYLVSPKSGSVIHDVANLHGAVAAVELTDKRPGVLLTTPLSGGAFELTMWLLRGLGESFRFTVFLSEETRGSDRRMAAMAELAERVYPVADFLDPTVWPSVAADLIRAREMDTVLRVGRAFDIERAEDSDLRIVDLPLGGDQVWSGADAVVALSAAVAAKVSDGAATVGPLVTSPGVAADLPDAEHGTSIRATFGVPDETRLVLTIADMVADQRPEDVAAVAHRLRHLDGVHFLLVGDGELTSTVSDIARHFGLDNFTLAPRTHDLFNLVMAADAVLITAENDPWSLPAAAALALGRPLIASDVESREELIEAASITNVSLVSPGDLTGFASAVKSIVEEGRRPRTTKKAWKAAGLRSRKALRLVDAVLRGDPAPSDGNS